ncbi:maleylacetoacetate isomerase [Marinobacterium jannaschii]|uniref:maleylacetoacetate isomerase n=1 Tax=Marinobacterium jannaschii TaxID=64970 RepID=UPI000484EA02|nr:maleylacetoacetate isomerase [Marinobacterium jannaschii]
MKLYTYWRSSAAYRVRIALNLKGLPYQSEYVHLVKDGGEQRSAAYRKINPQQLVPSLETDAGEVLTQSLAMIEYLDECYPDPALLPADPVARAKARSMAQLIACEVHPLNNLRVLQHLGGELGLDKAAQGDWYRHWLAEGFKALEALLAGQDKQFCCGDAPGLADICLVPQVYNARRFELDLTPYPNIRRIDARCRELEAFAAAAPEAQGDAP